MSTADEDRRERNEAEWREIRAEGLWVRVHPYALPPWDHATDCQGNLPGTPHEPSWHERGRGDGVNRTDLYDGGDDEEES